MASDVDTMDGAQSYINKHNANIAQGPNLHRLISTLPGEEETKDESWREMQNICVITRFRPANQVELSQNLEDIPPQIDGNRVTLTQTNEKTYQKDSQSQYESVLDHIFNTDTTQKQVFTKVGKPLLEAGLGGFNATLFAYGQTGSGKTYSTFGANDDGSGTDTDSMGIIPRSFVYIFERLDQKCSQGHITGYHVSIQLLQIYNKKLLDLLNPDAAIKLQIKFDFKLNSVYVKHLTKINISNARGALACIIEASSNRIVASHKLNAHSSRSHMLVLVKVEQFKEDGSSINSNINFGDLAGSENINKAHGKSDKGKDEDEIIIANERRREGIAINSSLSALTRCIHNLVKGQVPSYRESPLTHLLQDSLGGNSKTILLVCASPHIYNRNETVQTLRFAATAKAVKNKAKINQTLSVKALKKRIKELEAENKRLKKRLKKRNKGKEPYVGVLGKRISMYWGGAGEKKKGSKANKKEQKKLLKDRTGDVKGRKNGNYKVKGKKAVNKTQKRKKMKRNESEDSKYDAIGDEEEEEEDEEDEDEESTVQSKKSLVASVFYCYVCGQGDEEEAAEDVDEELQRGDSDDSSSLNTDQDY
eukprot:79624_1